MQKKLNLTEYYSILESIQNRMTHVDIMTFTALMDDEEKLRHLFHYAFRVEGLK